jgi:alanine racemase
MQVRPTEAIVDLGAVVQNYREAARLSGAPVMPIVKANAYGHGAIPVAHALTAAGAPMFGVALVEEGLALRNAGIRAPILVLGATHYDGAYEILAAHALTPVIFTEAHLKGYAHAARAAKVSLPAHVKIDTGMGRIGLLQREIDPFIAAARSHPEVRIEGICTHFANADLADRAMTDRQVTRFNAAIEAFEAAGFPLAYRHLANSAGTIDFPGVRQDLVRPGLMLYGYSPFAAGNPARDKVKLTPAMTWKTAIIHLKTVDAGTPISYGSRWTTRRSSRIATLPVGYADGYNRKLTGSDKPGFGNGEVLVGGKRCPIAGTVCMDMLMVDVTEVPNVTLGDEVLLIGSQGQARIGADELAERAGTIAYEILCGVGERVHRRYLGA